MRAALKSSFREPGGWPGLRLKTQGRASVRGSTPHRGIPLTLAALLALALVACAPVPVVTTGELVERAAITWVDGRPSDEVAERLLEALEAGRLAYVERYGQLPRRIAEVLVYRRERLPRPGKDLSGECSWSHVGDGEAVIRLAIGRPLRTESWVHELHHARIGDSEHTDPSWPKVSALSYRLAKEAWGE